MREIGTTKSKSFEFNIETGVPPDAVQTYLRQKMQEVAEELIKDLSNHPYKRVRVNAEVTDLVTVPIQIREHD